MTANKAKTSSLPLAWSFEARSREEFEMASARPWNWLELDPDDAARLWPALAEFVVYLNARYIERAEQLIPPCWAEHGALAEELTTLYWARFHAFESEIGTIGGAQFWHNYSLPMFLQRMPRWLGSDRLRKCQSGNHEEIAIDPPRNSAAIALRTRQITEMDCAERQQRRVTEESAPTSPRRRESQDTPRATNQSDDRAPEHFADGT